MRKLMFVGWRLWAAALLAPLAAAQEASVAPGINENFENPDVERYVAMFEGEDRAIYRHRNEIVEVLALKSGMDVVDVGAGTGFFSLMMAERVKPGGTVYAVDISDEFVEHIKKAAEQAGYKNVDARVCGQRSIDLPENTVDVAFVCDVYHHFEYPRESLASIHKALRPEGKLVIVDFERVEGVTSPFSLSHVRAGKGATTDEIKNAGFDLEREVDILEEQYVLVFTKRLPQPDSTGADE